MKKILILTAISLISCRQYDLQIEKIKYYARKHSTQEHLALGLVREESNFNRLAVSGKNAKGLTQVIYKWHKSRCNLKSESDLLDEDINLDCGLSHLRELYLAEASIVVALAKYNVGEGNYRKHERFRRIGHAYAARVLKHSKEYL